MIQLILEILCKVLSSFNQKWFSHSYAWPCILCEGWASFYKRHISKKLCGFSVMFLNSFTSFCVYFSSLYKLPSSSFRAVFDVIFSNIDEVLPTTHLLMCLSLETLTLIMRTDSRILAELIDLVKSVITFVKWPYSNYWRSYSHIWLWLSQSSCFWFICFFWYNYLIYNSFHSVVKFLLCCCLGFTSSPTWNRVPCFIA